MRGRKPILVIGLVVEIVRAVLFAFVTNYAAIVVIELLDGVTGAIINVLSVLIITDLTAGTGRFNVTQGAIGALLAVAAAVSTSVSGFVFQTFGITAGFLALAGIAAASAATAWAFLPETKPERYD
jgi:MFS family permease